MSIIERAARAMLAYEEWLAANEGESARYTGETADAIISRHVSSEQEWMSAAYIVLDRANELRGGRFSTAGQRKIRKARPRFKLSPADVADILSRSTRREFSARAEAERFGVHERTIYHAIERARKAAA